MERDNTEAWTAAAIGAVVGIGAILLVRARQEEDTSELVKRLRPVQKGAKRVVKVARKEAGRYARNAGDAGDELLSASRDILDELREGASEIVRSTRKELRSAVKDSMREARKAARSALR